MLSVSVAALGFQAPVAPVPAAVPAINMMDKAGLETLAKELNPVVGFWDPLNLAEAEFWGDSDAATIGFLREAEIKHGRVAMAAFVGFIVHSNGIKFPFPQAYDYPAGSSAQEVWDLCPEAAKWQIILTIGFFEFWRENAYVLKGDGQTHYMRGGKPGYMPTFDMLPHPVPFNLFDPFQLSKGKSEEAKARGLKAEINNGRLAQIGIIAFLSEAKVPGSVPALSGLIKPYSGEVMAPFDANFHIF